MHNVFATHIKSDRFNIERCSGERHHARQLTSAENQHTHLLLLSRIWVIQHRLSLLSAESFHFTHHFWVMNADDLCGK
ncbi:Uncharacterised protein [Vibrio cholerae]|uniref:Uncharacterized protein n=1 Tax=Vibrio cholerae TaxID=666 RepID=A0A655Z2U2_VIBCL|nr:Uncharacterised protein [Vibrio cholerae]CSA99059.1 Uncharacterised protein [Vibrio cholerae]CSB40765.1 Uncharacterised protein [Vibrio cholerae]CSB41852.1 Uncharacterised protein [Vibrio cholerae]CSC17139.1 Uncharacterised protein [Vibrio cholerae]